MPLIEWRDSYKIGIESVDHEHKELIELINALYELLQRDASIDAVEAFLGEINVQISAHFALEEKVMRELRYDGYEAHKASHEVLLEELRDIMDKQEAGEFTDLEEVLGNRMQDWFTNHFRDVDAPLHHFLEERGIAPV